MQPLPKRKKKSTFTFGHAAREKDEARYFITHLNCDLYNIVPDLHSLPINSHQLCLICGTMANHTKFILVIVFFVLNILIFVFDQTVALILL